MLFYSKNKKKGADRHVNQEKFYLKEGGFGCKVVYFKIFILWDISFRLLEIYWR